VGSTVGELGCWVDPSVTRLIQTGLEHSRVPDVGAYVKLGKDLGIRSILSLTTFLADSMSPKAFYSTLVKQTSSHLLGVDSAFAKLVALSSAALARNAIDYQLELSVLLKGARGTGKFTTVAWVSQHLGTHLLEVRVHWNDLIISAYWLSRLTVMISSVRTTHKRKEPFVLGLRRPKIVLHVSWYFDISKLWPRRHKFLKLAKV
jgi:hypothetical protein